MPSVNVTTVVSEFDRFFYALIEQRRQEITTRIIREAQDRIQRELQGLASECAIEMVMRTEPDKTGHEIRVVFEVRKRVDV